MLRLDRTLIRLFFRLGMKRRFEKGLSIEGFRRQNVFLTCLVSLFPNDARTENVCAHGVPCRWVTAPGASPDKVVLYFHGGGYVLGGTGTHADWLARLSSAARARVLAVDYRVAPEHPFPAAILDAKAAYAFLLESGVDPARIAIAGDSAGGGLSVALLLTLRDEGRPLPAALVLISPWLDLALSGESLSTRDARDPMLSKVALRDWAQSYLAGEDPRAPLASPLYARLHALPPTMIHVGDDELIVDDSTRFAARLKEAEGEVTLTVWPGMMHVFPTLFRLLPEARRAVSTIGVFLQERLESAVTRSR